MKLKDELKLKHDVGSKNHEVLLSIVLTASMLLKLSDRFLAEHGITGTQLNILMTLNAFDNEGLSQQELSQKLVVTKSNVVGLIDRLEDRGYVERRAHAEDRRYNVLFLTNQGLKLIRSIEGLYLAKVDRMIGGMTKDEKQAVLSGLETVRDSIRQDEMNTGGTSNE
jgi:DNA-binding MarR family transcriptional regulator